LIPSKSARRNWRPRTYRLIQRKQAAAEWQELFKKEINFDVDAVRSLEDRHRVRRLNVRRRRQPRKWIQDSVLSRQKLTAARTWKIRRPVPAVHKGHMRKGPSRYSTASVAPKGRRLQKTQRVNPE
jgi:hypothetical protein